MAQEAQRRHNAAVKTQGAQSRDGLQQLAAELFAAVPVHECEIGERWTCRHGRDQQSVVLRQLSRVIPASSETRGASAVE